MAENFPFEADEGDTAGRSRSRGRTTSGEQAFSPFGAPGSGRGDRGAMPSASMTSGVPTPEAVAAMDRSFGSAGIGEMDGGVILVARRCPMCQSLTPMGERELAGSPWGSPQGKQISGRTGTPNRVDPASSGSANATPDVSTRSPGSGLKPPSGGAEGRRKKDHFDSMKQPLMMDQFDSFQADDMFESLASDSSTITKERRFESMFSDSSYSADNKERRHSSGSGKENRKRATGGIGKNRPKSPSVTTSDGIRPRFGNTTNFEKMKITIPKSPKQRGRRNDRNKDFGSPKYFGGSEFASPKYAKENRRSGAASPGVPSGGCDSPYAGPFAPASPFSLAAASPPVTPRRRTPSALRSPKYTRGDSGGVSGAESPHPGLGSSPATQGPSGGSRRRGGKQRASPGSSNRKKMEMEDSIGILYAI
eukprot:CAMPEP_0194282910 /NCGR_PEP_ID=MMETSP0169-20130528/24224_1 /TAXON_ID=218684 /ORGANISM="Corethron pennatum, Strain L29A3" /LENGTH=420 /DNA_ID=CAMNT_0039028377 /DNA_START=23 /DNA_END=1285 /DNA_ORIENTATION=+